MFYDKQKDLFLPDAYTQNTYVKRTARRIADGVLEKHRTGVPMQKAINIMMNQLAKVARKQTKTKAKTMMPEIKSEIQAILSREG